MRKMSSITLGELDRAFAAYQDSLKKHGIPVKAVFMALKSLEKDRGLNMPPQQPKGKQ